MIDNRCSGISDWRYGHSEVTEEFFLTHVSKRVRKVFSSDKFVHTDTYMNITSSGHIMWRIQGYYPLDTLIKWQNELGKSGGFNPSLGLCSLSSRGLEVNCYEADFVELLIIKLLNIIRIDIYDHHI